MSGDETRSDRAWALPRRPWVMRMRWSELLFAHWRVSPDSVAQHLPEGVELDTRDGDAWIGVVPFLMSKVSPRCVPPLPKLSRFLELNVRTYVVVDGKPGVWFFSLDAESKLAVRAARATFNLPYMDANMAMNLTEDGEVQYRSRRTHRGEKEAVFDARYQAEGESFEAQPGTLEHWLTARYCLYSVDRGGHIFRGEIDHPPWTLRTASYDETTNTMGTWLGFDFTASPLLLCADPVDVKAWMVSRCGED